jgi:Mrp family chromosome partitioning ATPase
VLPVTDAVVLSEHADATLLVASARETSRRVMARAVELLGQVGAPVVGTVLNGVIDADAYGYAYGYKYYRAGEKSTDFDEALLRTNGQVRERQTPRP